MADVVGLNHDVYFGDPEKPLPDWRAEPERDDENDEDVPLTAEARKVLVGMLGFDPAESREAKDAPLPSDTPPGTTR